MGIEDRSGDLGRRMRNNSDNAIKYAKKLSHRTDSKTMTEVRNFYQSFKAEFDNIAPQLSAQSRANLEAPLKELERALDKYDWQRQETLDDSVNQRASLSKSITDTGTTITSQEEPKKPQRKSYFIDNPAVGRPSSSSQSVKSSIDPSGGTVIRSKRNRSHFWNSDLKNEEVTERQIGKEKAESNINRYNHDKVLVYLFDFNNDGKIDDKDNNVLNGNDLLSAIEEHPDKLPSIVNNLGKLVGLNVNSTEELYNALKNKPELKEKILYNLHNLSKVGINPLIYMLEGDKGVKKTVSNLEKNGHFSEEFANQLTNNFGKAYDVQLREYEQMVRQKLSSGTLTQAQKNDYENILNYLKTNKRSFVNNFRVNALSLGISLIEDNKGVAFGPSISNTSIDNKLKQITAGLVDGMQVNAGFAISEGKFAPGIGVNFSLRDFDLSENVKAKINAGLFMSVPYVTGQLEFATNKQKLQEMGLRDLSNGVTSFGVGVNLSTFASGVSLYGRKDIPEGIKLAERKFLNIINGIYPDGQDFDYNKSANYIKNMTGINNADKEYLLEYLSNVQDTLNRLGYSTANPSTKRVIIQKLKSAIYDQWKTETIQGHEKKGWRLTGGGIGVQFLGGFLPMPTLGVSGTKIKYKPENDVISGAEQSVNGYVLTPNMELNGIENLKNNAIENYLNANLRKYTGIAQRNPRDYPRFLQAYKSGDINTAKGCLLEMLRTDPILKSDKETQILRNRLAKNDYSGATTAYILSQFFDVFFIDRSGIGTVLKNDNEWQRREGGLRGVYDNPQVYNKVSNLRNQARRQIGGSISVSNQRDLMGLVASYKIDGKRKSMGRGEVLIPFGVGQVVTGSEISVTGDSLLEDHILNNIVNSKYFDELVTNINNKLSRTNKPPLNKNQVYQLLKNGSYNGIKIERDFVFTLYGRCANETLGIRIKSLNGQSLAIKPIVPNVPDFTATNVHLGVVGGKKEKKDKTPSDGGSNPGDNGVEPFDDGKVPDDGKPVPPEPKPVPPEPKPVPPDSGGSTPGDGGTGGKIDSGNGIPINNTETYIDTPIPKDNGSTNIGNNPGR